MQLARIFSSLLVISVSAAVAETPPQPVSSADWQGIRAAREHWNHSFREVPGGHAARTPGQQWRSHFDSRGFLTTPDHGNWTWGLELESYGFAGSERSVANHPTPVAKTDGNRYRRQWNDTLTEWYVNDTRGLEHGFVVQQPPAHGEAGTLVLNLRVRGGLTAAASDQGRTLRFSDSQGATVLTYSGLKAWDADGRYLSARMSATSPDAVRYEIEKKGARYPITIDPIAQQAYLKASNTGANDLFGWSVAISGNTVAIGAKNEASSASGIGGNQADNTAAAAGAVYVFVRSGSTWTQQAYIKASNTGAGDEFGASIALSGDTLVVGAAQEDSNAIGIGGNQSSNTSANSGAVYVFTRSGTTWTQQAYIKASNSGSGDNFGATLDIVGDTLIVGAPSEDSSATGIGGNQADNTASGAGAAYVFTRSGTLWTQQAYLKASNTGTDDAFGGAVAVSGDTAIVGAAFEDSNASGIGGSEADNSASDSGAAYIFMRSGTVWMQQAYVKASNTGAADFFGTSVDVSGDTAIAGATGEDSAATGVNGNESDESSPASGAAYIFARNGSVWTQQAYVKASNTGTLDDFGVKVALSNSLALIGADLEDSNSTGINGDAANNLASAAGAAYLFERSGTVWNQTAYLKASNTEEPDNFGFALAISGGTGIVSAPGEDGNATGVNGNEANNSASNSGAAYTYLFYENNADLSGLALSHGVLSPSFAAGTTDYTASVPYLDTAVTVTPTAVEGLNAAITVNGTPVLSGSASASIPLTVGPNAINIVVNSEDGISTKTYTITVTRVDTTLAALTLSSGTLSPALSGTTGTYTAEVAYATDSITFTPTVSDPGSTVTVNGVAVNSGSASAPLVLSTGVNAIAVVVTGPGGDTQTYTVNVFREGRFLTGTVDSAGFVGRYTSLAVVDGKPAISYYNQTNADLKYAVNTAADGSGAWTVSTVDSAGVVGLYTSLAVVDGKPAISYSDGTNGDLKFAINAATDGSGAWAVSTVDSAGVVGLYTSLAVVDGKPAISYYDATNGNLKFAINAAGDGSGAWTRTTVDSAGTVGEFTSLAVVDGKPAISYHDFSNRDLKYAVNAAADGSGAWTVNTVDSEGIVGDFTSLAVVDDKPAISYYDITNADLKYALNTAADGSGAWTVSTVDGAGAVGEFTSLAVVDGKPAISYYNQTNADLKYAVNAAADGSGAWTVSAVDSEGIVGTDTSLAVVDGKPAISYVSSTNGDLEYAVIVNVGPAYASNAYLAGLMLSSGTLSPSFGGLTNSGYNADVSTETLGVSVTPTVFDSAATVTVNGSPVSSGSPSAAIPLAPGPNVITTVVTARDGVTTKTYTCTVTRAAPVINETRLFSLALSSGTLAPAYAMTTTAYTVLQSTATAGMSLTATLLSPFATLTLNGQSIPNGSPTSDIPLSPGVNTLTLLVTAEDTVSTRTYTLTVNRLSTTVDTDGDGLNDLAEVNMAGAGFDWQAAQPALVAAIFNNIGDAQPNLNAAGYYAPSQQNLLNAQGYFTTDQVQALHLPAPLIQKNPGTGTFTLKLGLEKSTTLLPGSFTHFPFTGPGTSVNGEGKVEFQFTSPDNAAFFRLQTEP